MSQQPSFFIPIPIASVRTELALLKGRHIVFKAGHEQIKTRTHRIQIRT